MMQQLQPSSLVDYVKIQTETIGVGAVTLGDAFPGFRGKEALVDANQYSYVLTQLDNTFELGWGVYDEASGTFTRNPEHTSAVNGTDPIALAGNAVISFVMSTEDFVGWIINRANTWFGQSEDAAGPLTLVPGYNGVANISLAQLDNQLPGQPWDGMVVTYHDEYAYSQDANARSAAVLNHRIFNGAMLVATLNTAGGKVTMRFSNERGVWVVVP